jgi:hypothetical protein
LRYYQVANQFLATKRHYRNPLFTRLAFACWAWNIRTLASWWRHRAGQPTGAL